MRFAITTTVAILALACTALLAGPALAHFPGEGVGEPELAVKARKLPSFLRIRAVFGTAPPEGCPITKPEDALTDEWDRYYSEFCASFRYQEADIVLTITRGKKNKVVYQESHAAREGSWDDRVYGYEITGPDSETGRRAATAGRSSSQTPTCAMATT